MADEYERIIDLPLAASWSGEIAQDTAGGVTERVPVSMVEDKLQADGFVKLNQITPENIGAEPSLGNTAVGTFFLRAVNSVRSWVALGALAFLDAISDSQIASGAAIAWSKIDKTGAVPGDVGAPVLGETSSTAYRGDRGKTAYDHSLSTTNPHGTTAAQVGAMALLAGQTNVIPKLNAAGNPVASGLSDDGNNLDALGRVVYGKIFRSAWAANDTAVGGSSLGVLDSATDWTKGWMLQLGASNTLDFWNHNGTSWERYLQLFPGGSLALNGASMPSWDSQSKPLMIGRNAAVLESDYGSGSNVLLATNYFAASDGNDKSLSATGHSQYLQLADGGGIVFKACDNNGVNGIITPIAKWRVDKDGVMGLPALASNVSKPLFVDKFGNIKKDSPSDISSSFTLSDTTPFFMVVAATSITVTLPSPVDYKGLKYTFTAHSDVTLNLTSGAGIRYQDLKGSGSWAPNANTVTIVMQGTDFGGDHEIVELWSSGQRWFARA